MTGIAGTGPDRFGAAIAAIDRANADDPTVMTVDGAARPKELVHAERMTAWVRRLDPEADEAQLLAARAHHLRRWLSPRTDHPEGRAGYLRWRSAQRKRHAAEVAEILLAVGYDDELVGRVGAIVTKTGLAHDRDVQVHEDALCLVFLETQLEAVTDQLGEDKVVDVLVKTLTKMRPEGIAAARELPLDARGRRLLERAAAEHRG
ncbi:MAG: DUF4202 domain-containing protein [Acidimicrobiales bacterium]